MKIEVIEKKLDDACLKGEVEYLEALMREDEPNLILHVSVATLKLILILARS